MSRAGTPHPYVRSGSRETTGEAPPTGSRRTALVHHARDADEPAEPSLHVSLFALVEAMRRVLESLPEEERHHRIALERITLQERMVAVMDQLRSRATDSLRFEDLLRDADFTRHRIVMTFLAILELAKLQALRLFQNIHEDGMPFGPVRVRAAVHTAPDSDQIAAAGKEAERA